MKELEESVLAVRSRLTPEDFSGVVVHPLAVGTHGLTVRFHGELLKVRREAREIFRVGQHGMRLSVEEV